MDDCISRKKAIEEIKRVFDQSTKGKTVGTRMLIEAAFIQARSIILGLPALDVRENVRGEWTNISISMRGSSMADCSVCGAKIHDSFTKQIPANFCPHCGAAMKKWEG